MLCEAIASMKNLLILIAVLAVASAKSIDIDPSQVQPFESIGIGWSQIQPIEDSDQYWDRLPADLQYLRKQEPDRRIVNGQEATPGQFPYQVYLTYTKNDKSSRCGGSILNSNNVLTAAHCVWRAEQGTAFVGLHNRREEEPTQQRIPFAAVYYHSGYNGESSRDDIAVVRLSRHITFNDRVQPVHLPDRGDNRQFAGLTGTVAGFGNLCDDCDGPDVLMYTSNTIVSNAECLAVWGNPESIQDQNLCLSTAGETST
ncbi:transmembrane protease [Culex quinquefasciatus]|uniref:Transmembrane protease n=1 Tax=Culex quinquefasciatus TaxID=7176 RepID=B0X8Z7_CULQU|nr:transmembrane protease [Culex quinquefasciatus]|eukprot:XP_001866118.1 transmembrane protease [Culex quinquefasciatus]